MSKTEVILEGGKYCVSHNHGADFRATRYGQPWRDLTGDGLVLALVQEVERLREIVGEVHAWAVCGALASPEDMMQNLPRIEVITRPYLSEIVAVRAAADDSEGGLI